jgi:glycine/serine hydroxymethyltransferase
LIAEVLEGLAKVGEDGDNSGAEKAVQKRVIELCQKFPIYS